MRTITPDQLRIAYESLYSAEKSKDVDDANRIYGNWLRRYEADPPRAIATTNWCGKVTRALFNGLELKQPKTKAQMITALTAVPLYKVMQGATEIFATTIKEVAGCVVHNIAGHNFQGKQYADYMAFMNAETGIAIDPAQVRVDIEILPVVTANPPSAR